MNATIALRARLRATRQWWRYQRLPQPDAVAAAPAVGDASCVIPPSDPGSLGDAAMMRALADRHAAAGMDVVRFSGGGDHYPGTRGAVEVARLRGRDASRLLVRYRRVLCLGADVMDGHYGYADACLRLRLLGLAAAMGREARLLGFSFNATPHPLVVEEFARLHAGVAVCVRDPVSLARLKAVTRHPLRQVADLAFLIQPVPPSGAAAEVASWAQAERAEGRLVLGLNLHPLFALDHGGDITPRLVASCAELMWAMPHARFVLIVHDHRASFGDGPCLRALFDALPVEDRARVRLVDSLHDPAEIKGFVAALDGVITGRMHLAIAALGQGVPVAGITYQGKFEGLLQHFSLGEGFTIAPPEAAEASRLAAFVDRWLGLREVASIGVRARLPQVLRLAQANFS